MPPPPAYNFSEGDVVMTDLLSLLERTTDVWSPVVTAAANSHLAAAAAGIHERAGATYPSVDQPLDAAAANRDPSAHTSKKRKATKLKKEQQGALLAATNDSENGIAALEHTTDSIDQPTGLVQCHKEEPSSIAAPQDNNSEEKKPPVNARFRSQLCKATYKQPDNVQLNRDQMTSEKTRGPFSKNERDKVWQALQDYLAMYQIAEDDVPLLLRRKYGDIHDYHLHSQIFKTIHVNCGLNRTRDQVQRYLLQRYPLGDNGPWTPEDDENLRQLVVRYGHSWRRIEDEMERTNCKERFRVIEAKDKQLRMGRWDEEEENMLLDAVKELMKKRNVTDPTQIKDWTELARKVGTRRPHQCMRKWNDGLHLKLQGGSSVVYGEKKIRWNRDDDVKLLENLLKQTALDETEVKWWNLGAGKDGWRYWPGDTLQDKWVWLRDRIPDTSERTFHENIQWALNNLDTIRKGTADRPTAGRKPAQKESTISNSIVKDDDDDDFGDAKVENFVNQLEDSGIQLSESLEASASRTCTHSNKKRKKIRYLMSDSPELA
ncbi:hypothetical protein SeMB42_g03794 [Synchytrium endobioticum]|uniref:Myb-like domain-containing protein n=1 Tax=Synchytrium endobioticum TaxID=286115 RepID=A0A507D4R3_9FUNG|nr:hypothetical protein SeLEV6574_g04748 [Synchytrium endobioticum]TPX46228.1 hypothetical protein SeMB42_g03794 [Synchytrium endobioticum]